LGESQELEKMKREEVGKKHIGGLKEWEKCRVKMTDRDGGER